MEVKAQLLRELLTESNAFGYLMAGGGPGGEAGACSGLLRLDRRSANGDALPDAPMMQCWRASCEGLRGNLQFLTGRGPARWYLPLNVRAPRRVGDS